MRTLYNPVRRIFLLTFLLINLLATTLQSRQQISELRNENALSSGSLAILLHQETLMAKPVAMASSNSPVCEGDTIFFMGDGAGVDGFYSWTGPNGFSSSEQNPFIANAQAGDAGVYQLIVEDSFGEKDTTTTLLTIRLDHILNLQSDPGTEDQKICDGTEVDTIIYTLAGGATAATVSGLPGGMNFSFLNSQFKIFGIPVSGLSGVGTASFTIEVISDGNVCTPDTATIDITVFKTIAEADYSGPVCETGEIQLTSDGSASGGSYSWTGPNGYASSEQNPTISNIESNQSGMYTVTVTDDAGCSDVASVDVTIYPNPFINAGLDTAFCVGGSTILNAMATGGAAPYSYTWDQGLGDGQSHNIMPVTTTIYTVSVTDSLNCSNTDQIEITVNENPVAFAGDDQQVCFGSTTDISASATGGNAPYSYFWDNGLGEGQTQNILPLDSMTYIVTVTDSLSCTSTDEMSVTINSVPAVITGADKNICAGTTTTVTASANGGSGPYTYTWDQGLGDGQMHNVNPDTATIYTVTVTDANGCTATNQTTITVILLPTPEIAGDTIICDGDSTIFNAGSGYASYLWDTGESTQQISVDAAGMYVVSVTDLNGCMGMDSVTLMVNEIPIADAGQDESICMGDSTSLTGGASGDFPPFTFSWDNGLGEGQNFDISPDSTTTYTLTVVDTNICVGIDQITITVNENPTADAGLDQAICFGDSTTISASTIGGSAPYTYTWDNGLGEGQEFTISPDTNTVYSVIVIDANTCQSTDTMEVIVHENPTADAGLDATICFGDSTTITASANGGLAPYIYNWDNGLGDGESFDVSPDSTTIYTLTVTDSLTCMGTDQLVVSVNTNPLPIITGDESICDGDSTVLDGGAGFDTYTWSTGDTTQQITVSSEDSYGLMVTDSNACVGLDTFLLTILENPTANAGLDVSFCHGDSTTIMASANGGLAPYSYTWDNGLGVGQSFTVGPDTSTVYTVNVVDSLGCSDTDQMMVTVYTNPVPVISGDTSACQGDTVMFDAGPDFIDYLWSTGDTTQQIFTDTSGMYTVMVIDTNSCMGEATISLTVHENPDAIANLDQTICFGDSTTIAAYATGGNPPYTFTWDNGLGEGAEFLVSPDSTTSYVVMAVDSVGCSALDTVVVHVNENPVANAGLDAAICFGDSTTITASANGGLAPYAFSWDNGLGDGESFDVSPELTTTFTVSATDSLGCVGTDEVLITVYANPVVQILGLDAVCNGDSTEIDAGADYVSYVWDTGDTTQFITISEAGDYAVMVVDTNGCAGSDSFAFSLNENPVADAGEDAAFCLGDSITISGSADGGTAPYTYSWDNGLGAGQSFDVSPDSTTIYSVMVVDSLGCSSSDQIEITANTLPTPQITGDLIICEDQSGILNAGAGYDSYSWSTGDNTQQINVSDQGIYSVMVVDTNGCKATAFNAVMVTQTNQSIITGEASLCGTDTTELNAGDGYTSYLWSTGDTSQLVSVSSPGIYSVTVTNSADCPIYDEQIVVLFPGVSVEAGADKSICLGDSTGLSAAGSGGTGPFNYNWDNGLGAGQTHDVSPVEMTNYTVTLTDANGCTDTDEVVIGVNDLPEVNAGDDQEICAGDTVEVNATVIVGTGTFNYTWDNGLGDGQTHSFVPDITQEYTVVVTDENGCTDANSISIVVNPLPIINISGDLVLCNGLANTLDVAAGFETYLWNTGDTTSSISVSEAGAYGIEVSDENGCSASAEVAVIDGIILDPVITGELEFCMGDFSELDAGDGYDNYLWSTGDTTQTILVNNSGVITVTVSNINSCDASTEVAIVVNENPLVFAGEDAQVCEGDSIELFAEAIGGNSPYAYVWNQGLGEGQSHNVSPAVSTEYIVVAADAKDCINEDTILVSVSPFMEVELSADSSLVITGGVMPYDTVFTTEGDSLSVVITDAFGCTAEDQVFITGTKDFELQFVNKVYPNPVNELLYIEYADGMKMNLQLKLVDISGRVAFSSPVRLEQISTSAIEAGTYLLQIISAEGVQSLPVVIMH